MKILFWSPVHGQTATTSNLLTIAITSAINSNKKNLITQSHYSLNNLEKPIIGTSATEISELFSDIGVDALSRYLKTGELDKETIEGCCISLLNKNLNILPGTTKSNEEIFENEMVKTLPYILKAAENYHDIVFVDTNAGNKNKITNVLLDEADLIVVNLSQNAMIIDDYIQNYDIDENKTFFLIGNYNYRSRYNITNLIRKYEKFNKSNIAAIPYNVGYSDAQSNGEVIKYLLRNQNCDKDDCNYYFINTIKNATDLILKKANGKSNNARWFGK